MVASKTARGKVGRPSSERAGEVDERILDAAQAVFLAHGFEGASVDEIAQTAHAGKPTIYARYPNKAALFAAVIVRQAARNTQYENLVAHGSDFRTRLISLGIALIERALREETIGLMRSAIAEGPRFPELSREINDIARKRATLNISKMLDELSREEGLSGKGAFAPHQIEATTRLFLDTVLFPMLFRSLLCEDPRALKKALPGHVEQRVDYFIAATAKS